MDVFKVHQDLLQDYRAFTSGAVDIRDERIKQEVEQSLDEGDQWPDPWLSLNPSFASGGQVSDLVDKGLLHPECRRIFLKDKPKDSFQGKTLSLYQHQRDAIDAARTGQSYVLTTGTGSGKSMAYIVPIVDRVLREREKGKKKGIKAIIVYPMNALANSQRYELEKFLQHGYGPGHEPVTYARYTGQEKPAEREQILKSPPDILLTNYVMLELMLTRPYERQGLITAAEGLQFLVLDELHTYRGRQGADVAMLIRRVRDACKAPDVQCVGTSATMASGGTTAEQQETVADVASRLFDAEIPPARVISETLVRATVAGDPTPEALKNCVRQPRVSGDYAELSADPLAHFIESTFGLDVEAPTGKLVRRRPTTVEQAAEELAAQTGESREACAEAIRRTLDAGARVRHPETGRPLFAFRLHQFLSKGDTVLVSIEPEDTRVITRDYQLRAPGHKEKLLMPVTFCRQCGQEYLVVGKNESAGVTSFRHRRDTDDNVGYLYISKSSDFPWATTLQQAIDEGRIPDSWLTSESGPAQLVPSKRKYLPQPYHVRPDGSVSPGGTEGTYAAYIPVPLGFCLRCGVAYEQTRGSDFGKLARLDQEGRSSAVSVLSSSIVRSLKAVPLAQLPRQARKLLTFVDNRQDASLQAGHFNDFAQVTQLRGALYRAAQEAGDEGIFHEDVAQQVAAQLGMEVKDFSLNPSELTTQRKRTERALREVIAYRLYLDLERGWRVTMPNLEQTGLIRIDYADLAELAAKQDAWDQTFGPLRHAEPGKRVELCRILLDELRRVLAIDVDCLSDLGFEQMQKLSRQHLKDPWALPEREKQPLLGTAYARAGRAGGRRGDLNLSGRGRYGRYLRREKQFQGWTERVDLDDAQRMISDLLKVLAAHGFLVSAEPGKAGELSGYRINAAAIVWRAGDGKVGTPDPLRMTFGQEAGPKVNTFFRDLYTEMANGLAGLHAREHTAQVPAAVREEREEAFREADLPLLYCSPTMELGVDIADLNAVSMRNVPPTPANYAQRSGRAGRSGQPALVTTYCASGNSHDRYYFRRSQDMVSGSVVEPRLDLGNEDLVRSHVHAIWLAETEARLGQAMITILDIAELTLPLHPHLKAGLDHPQAKERAKARAKKTLERSAETLKDTSWWSDQWVDEVVDQAPAAFQDACDRWRDLYRKAKIEREVQHQRADDHMLSEPAKKRAKVRRAEAETQLRLLRNEQEGNTLSDFNPYRYLASEGFLPGYSFPRLPLAAYIPGTSRNEGDYLQRSRFIAIREFGPGALIYHEGSRYQVKRVQLPAESGGEFVTGEARRCRQCGYHHQPRPGLDRCELCNTELPLGLTGLMRLHTVFTERRERISSDEEERRRAGFDLETSYRFHDHGERKGRMDAQIKAADGTILATLSYGDSATVRKSNLGTSRRKPGEIGFWLDVVNGRWLAAKDTADVAGVELTDEETGLADGESDDDVRKMRVVPYVEDRRNILIFTLTDAVSPEAATSLQFALERGIEAVFQLEDSELDTEELPSGNERKRILFIESAEGGAGVLRRLQAEPHALADAATKALQIAHFNPVTGEDLGGPSLRVKCELGCYDCLLSFSNQRLHEFIDRHQVRDLLIKLAGATVERTTVATGRPHEEMLVSGSESSLEGRFVTFLKDHGYHLPDKTQVHLEKAKCRPDFVYESVGGKTAVFVDGPVHQAKAIAERDEAAAERLIDRGWRVIRFAYDEDWNAIVAEHPSVFGPGSK